MVDYTKLWVVRVRRYGLREVAMLLVEEQEVTKHESIPYDAEKR